MFTGIIASMGLFKGYRQGRHEMQIEAADLAPKLEPGASLAVNGVCLSLVRKDKGALVFDLSQETLDRTNLGALRPGARLNLELPLTLGSLVGGHLVSGHVDAVGKVVRLAEKRPGKRLLISFPSGSEAVFRPQRIGGRQRGQPDHRGARGHDARDRAHPADPRGDEPRRPPERGPGQPRV